MAVALTEAHLAGSIGEVPVGAVVVYGGRIIARSGNARELSLDPVAHAELLAIQAAATTLKRWRLTGCTLYCTLEPCPMCAGAIVNARLDRVVFGAKDPRAGAAGSLYDILGDTRLNHRPACESGIFATECGAALSRFFAARRRARAKSGS